MSHAALPYPIKHARYTVFVPYLDADGDPTDPTTPDTEVSTDAGAFADCAEEVSTISGSNGSGYLTLSGAETNGSLVALAAKVASGPKATLLEIRPRVLPILATGTAQAGAAGTITLASGASATDDFYNGCIIRTTGGTGGGGTGGANNQARVITDYVGSTKVATIEPNWETNPSSDTTYDVLLTEIAVNAVLSPAATTPPTAAAIRSEIDSNSTLLAAIASYIDTEVSAIKAKTDNLPAAPAAVGDIPTAIQNADALLKRDMSAVTGEAARSPLNAFRWLRNAWSIASGTLTVKKEDDTTTAWTSTTTQTAGNPVTGSDPA